MFRESRDTRALLSIQRKNYFVEFVWNYSRAIIYHSRLALYFALLVINKIVWLGESASVCANFAILYGAVLQEHCFSRCR